MTVQREPRRVLLIIAITLLAGATAFGLWHVLVGGLVNGNGRAAGFGVVLAALAGAALAGLLETARRRGRR